MAAKERLEQKDLIGSRAIIDTYRRNIESLLEYDTENYYFKTIACILIELLVRIDKTLVVPNTNGYLFKLKDMEKNALYFLRNQSGLTRDLDLHLEYVNGLTLLLTQNN